MNQHGLRFALRQALRGQHVLHFRSSDAEGQRAKSAVRAGVAIAADDGYAWLGQAQLRADHVHNALLRRIHIEQGHAEFFAVLLQRLNLARRDGIGNRRTAWFGGNVVIHGRDCALGLPHFAARRAKAVERLRRGHLVHQMQIDIQQRRLPGRNAHYVLIPDLLE